MFINTLPIIFTYTRLLNPIEFSLLLILIFLVIYINTSDYSKRVAVPIYDTVIGHSVLNHLYLQLLASWLGRSSLAMAFWPFFLLVNAVLYYIDYRIFNLNFTIASWKTAQLMLVLPSIWWIISVWRCSINSRYKIWCCLARAMTVYLLLELGLRFIIVSYYPNTFFDCQLLIVHYGDCQ
ncbi:MAG: hypothetical protein WAX77_00565 [Methylococcaceae bacterium]